jgi:hypothetical protein
MNETDDFQKLLGFFKALGNESRLKIVALLADGDLTVRELAEKLDLREPTVSEHLAMLKEAGLVTMRPDGNFRIYSFNAKALYAMNHDLLSRDHLASLASKDNGGKAGDQDDQKVLQNYFEGDRLTTIPAVRKKLLVVLRWLVAQFEIGRQYPEKEVNAIIQRHHEDYATLRRELIGHNLMKREKGVYWRPKPEEEKTE